MKLTPFADDSASMSFGGLTVGNGAYKLAIYGNLDITRNQVGLRKACELLAVVQVLEGLPDLPAQATKRVVAPKVVKSPFR